MLHLIYADHRGQLLSIAALDTRRSVHGSAFVSSKVLLKLHQPAGNDLVLQGRGKWAPDRSEPDARPLRFLNVCPVDFLD